MICFYCNDSNSTVHCLMFKPLFFQCSRWVLVSHETKTILQHTKTKINSQRCRFLIPCVANTNRWTHYEKVPKSHLLKSHRHKITQPLFKIGTYLNLQLISIMFQMHLQSVTDWHNHCQFNATIMDLSRALSSRRPCWWP